MPRVDVSPDMLRWARERAGFAPEKLSVRFSKYTEWEKGETRPTLKQLEGFAKVVHVPVGFLFLDSPPEIRLPIPDLRTVGGRQVPTPSPNLLDMLYLCQERQDWYREFARSEQQPPLEFIGSADLKTDHGTVTDGIRRTMGFSLDEQVRQRKVEDALRLFIRKAEDAGILVMVSGVVASSTKRKLDTEEFRGFALADPFAPIVFINGSDGKSAQMFTLAHEIAHLWLNSSGVSNISGKPLNGSPAEEVWCNAVAAELLVPLDALNLRPRNEEKTDQAMTRLSRYFKVSRLVILRRLLDAGWLDREEFDKVFRQNALTRENVKQTSGGDFYLTTISRVGHRFARALITSTIEGHTLYRDAFRMLGISDTTTFNKLSRKVGVMS